MRLSVNFKEFIQSFLHKSLMKYLKFNENKNQMIKEFDSLINGEERSDDEEEGEYQKKRMKKAKKKKMKKEIKL